MVMMGMKMAAVSSVSLLLLLTSIVTTTDSQDCNYHAAKKQDVTLPLIHVLKESDQLRWLHESKVIFDRRAKVMVTGNPDDVDQNGSLRLRNVDQSKAGTYTPTVYDDGQRIGNLKPMVLCVMEQSFKEVLKDVEKRVYRCRVYNKVSSLTSAPFRQNCTQSERSFKGVLKDVEKRVYRCRVYNEVSSLTSAPFRQNCTQSDEEELHLGWSNSNPQCQHQNHPPDHQKQQPLHSTR
ncbi:hypothetical protein fugu_002541 [Takifugu bimaculatus]|uniref:Immunoglobulin V-set domain-containing protein n=1 Tax=Takifugu bimaculatus TaxID=433685 RepID=A0A4Z2BQ57_9TELE|nr:hypothetical protein fugu_002541 [Takifugu bimaculatus]